MNCDLTRQMEEREKRDTEERRCGKCWYVPPDLLIASVVQTVLDNTVQQIFLRLDQKQAEDQAGFRTSYQTRDHLATYRMIEQKCHQWRIKCGQQQSTPQRHSTPLHTTQFGKPSNPAVSITTHQPPEEDLHRPERICSD